MSCIFDYKTALAYDRWLGTEPGRYIHNLEMELVIRLLKPLKGQRILDIGCGTGACLSKFKAFGLDVTGLDPSPYALSLAYKRLGHTVSLYEGLAEDLPFEDNEFDMAVIITTLGFMDDPVTALMEAARVTRQKLLIGALNRYSLLALSRRIKGLFDQTIYNQARFQSLWDLKRLVKKALGKTEGEWGSVIIFPPGLKKYSGRVERSTSLQDKNPLGAFIAMCVPLTYTTIADNIYAPTHDYYQQALNPAESFFNG